jgi:uncharacterized protein (DUF433 family)
LENIYVKSATRTQEQALFTPAEAAAVTHLPLKAVNNAIDKKTIAARTMRRGAARSARLVGESALVYLSLERELAGHTTPSFRRKLFKAIAEAFAQGAANVAVGVLAVDLRPSRCKVKQRIRDLRRAERLAAADADVAGGVPVFVGTRIPVHMIAQLLDEGETAETLRKGYPRLTDEMIRLAPLYASAHPLRGRPRRQPRRGRLNSVARVPLRDAASP